MPVALQYKEGETNVTMMMSILHTCPICGIEQAQMMPLFSETELVVLIGCPSCDKDENRDKRQFFMADRRGETYVTDRPARVRRSDH
jgi:hypothetical protein